jgi:glycosyltransferase involved in cell wall biosynthesis
MKILFLSHKFYPAIGGIEVNSEILAAAFVDAGHEVHLLTWTEEMGDKTFPYPVIRNPSAATLFKEHTWADVVYENNPTLRLAWPGLIIKRTSVVALRTWINRMNGEMGWQDKFKLVWLKRADGVIAVSKAVRDRCWPEAVVIGNPYRENLFRVIAGAERNKDFVYLGRLVSDKGVALAVTAFGKIVKAGQSSLTMTIIGDGPEKESLERLIIEMGLTSNIIFTGSLNGEKLVAELNKHKYMVVPSVWEEPFGNVGLEGMACGCLPIVSDGGGLPDAVGNAGLIFERGNTEDLVQKINNLLHDPSLEKDLRTKAALHLQDHHPDIVSKRYLGVIEEAYKKNNS